MRYLPGILLAQLIAILMTWLNRDRLMESIGWLQVLLPSLVVALVVGFWFSALSRRDVARNLEKTNQKHLREREDLRVAAEKAKAKVQRDAHKSIARETRKTHARANLKVGAALTSAIAFGVLMMFTQLASLGLILLSGAGGALAGYMGRIRRNNRQLSDDDVARLPSVNADSTSKSGKISLPRFGKKKN